MSGKHNAIVLLSGGLDSTLAVKMMIDQRIDMTAVHFTSLFCNQTPDVLKNPHMGTNKFMERENGEDITQNMS
jgi:tRNA U34 2-thiouridine synthase MnmA/TrmU